MVNVLGTAVCVAYVCAQSWPSLCDPMDCSLPGSSLHGAMGMDGIGETLQVGDDLLAHPELAVERQARTVDSSVSHRSHAHATTGNSLMIVEQVVGRTVSISHILKSRRTYYSVTQGNRTNLARREYR